MYSYNRLHFSFVFAYNLYYIDLDRRCCNKSITLILPQKYNIYRKTPKDFLKKLSSPQNKKDKTNRNRKGEMENGKTKRRTSERNHPYVSFIGMLS